MPRSPLLASAAAPSSAASAKPKKMKKKVQKEALTKEDASPAETPMMVKKKVLKKKGATKRETATQESLSAPKTEPKAVAEKKNNSADVEDLFASKAGWKNAMAAAEKKAQDQAAAEKEKLEAAKAEKLALRKKRQQEAEKPPAEVEAAVSSSMSGGGSSSSSSSTASAPAKRKAESLSEDKDSAKSAAKTGQKIQRTAAKPAVEKAGGEDGNAYRKEHEIVVDDASCPAPWEKFEAAEPAIGKKLTAALRKQGYESPTPIQAQSWPIALQGCDMVAVAKTGSGKTCGFLLPTLVRIATRGGPCPTPRKIDYYHSEPAMPSALVLAPTRELAQQIGAEAAKFAPFVQARVVCIYGGVAKGEQIRELKQGADILVATPGRLVDFAEGDKKNRDLKPCVDLSQVTYFVLDEAMLDMGFEPDIRKIVGWCPPSPKSSKDQRVNLLLADDSALRRQTLFFTATWPRAVQSVARSFTTSDAIQIRIGQSGNKLSANKSVTQIVSILAYDEKLAKLQDVLAGELKPGITAIIFAATKGGCDFLERKLNQFFPDIWVGVIHGDKGQWERDEALGKFRSLTAGKDEKRGVLVATDVAARGLDIPGVPVVVVYDFSPGNGKSGIESYVHRIGRTGRAGSTGKAFTFFSSEEVDAAKFVDLLRGADQVVPKKLEEIAAKSRGSGGKGKGGGKGGKSGKGKGKGSSKGRDRFGSNWKRW
eukprot:TRINITY_DN7697_c2_g1_i6.p1 TRINITY_DN7697_c2_g1~~TRINITY_DN7697_c2_g1_i6.p1  ORF type:complete len:708 (+),score=192.55 TRINITY_DN7697_c2_g1_i6:86-2209(+)